MCNAHDDELVTGAGNSECESSMGVEVAFDVHDLSEISSLGFLLDFSWFSLGFLLVFSWFSLVFLWFSFGSLLVFSLVSLDFSWFSCRFLPFLPFFLCFFSSLRLCPSVYSYTNNIQFVLQTITWVIGKW